MNDSTAAFVRTVMKYGDRPKTIGTAMNRIETKAAKPSFWRNVIAPASLTI
jgi:hypothetical protein